MARHHQWHVRGWPAVLLAPIAIPIILLITAGEIFGLKTSSDLSALEVEGYIRDFLKGEGGDWDWDDFTSIPITDPVLERIRQEASAVDLPLDDAGRMRLTQLLEEVRTLRTS